MPGVGGSIGNAAQASASNHGKTKLSYWFFGKIALFPFIMVFLAAGAIALLAFKPGLSAEGGSTSSGGISGFFASDDLSYALAGLVLSILCVIVLIFFLFWHVIRISFIFEPQEGKFTVYKRGIFRKSVLEFDMSDMSFHYFRTHFAENKRWLQFVVREGDIYFQLYSWRGKDTQTGTFLNLFQNLQQHLERAHEQMLMPIHPSSQYPTEIVSKDEFTLIGPFTARLKGFVARQRDGSSTSRPKPNAPKPSSSSLPDFAASQFASSASLNARAQYRNSFHQFSKVSSKKRSLDARNWNIPDVSGSDSSSVSSICEEQIEMIDYDSILRHFKYEKRLGGPIMPGEAKSKQHDLTSALVRKA